MCNNNSICQHYCLLTSNQCYYCHPQKISSYRCCSCLISIEEILTWIIICSLIFLFYNTIKLCIVTFVILSIIYWIYKQTDIPNMLKDYLQRQFDAWMNPRSSMDEQNSSDNLAQDDNASLNINTRIERDDEEVNTLKNDNDQRSLSTKTLSNSNLDINTISNHDFSKANNCDESAIKTTGKFQRNLNEKKRSHRSTTKKLLSTQNQDEFSSENFKFNNPISQAGYYGPIWTIKSFSKVSVASDKRTINDIFEQTKDIRQTIESLHEDFLQLKSNPNKELNDDLSIEDRAILKLATENLIQVILSTRNDLKSTIPKQFKRQSSQELPKFIKRHEKQETSSSIVNEDNQQSEELNSTHINVKSKQEVISNQIDNSKNAPFQHPNCVPVQTSFAMSSIMPRVPTKATLTPIDDDDDDDEKSYENSPKISQHIITTNEQFENILIRTERKSKNPSLLKQDSINYNNEQLDWAYYSSKPDLFPDTIHSSLPVIQSKNQHSSFKQTFLSHFHHRPKFTATNNPATLHSSSLNATNNIPTNISVSSDYDELNLQNNINATKYIKPSESSLTTEQRQIAQQLLTIKASFNYIWNKTLKHLKQRLFRVRKSRIIMSFDDIQQQKDTRNNDMNNFNALANTVNYEQETKITNDSIVSLFQSFDSAIQDGELLLTNEKSFNQDDSENEDALSKINNSLYSVTSQLILI